MVEDGSLHNYGLILRKLIYGIFASCHKHQSGYALPFTDDDRRRAEKFKKALSTFSKELKIEDEQDGDQILEDDEIFEQDEDRILDDDDDDDDDDDEIDSERRVNKKLSTVVPDTLIDSFHLLVKPLLYPHKSTSHSRWDDPLECFVALLSLSQEGNFKGAEEMSQPLAQLHYLMRSAIFYEALLKKKNSTEDLTLEVYVLFN